MLDYTLMLSDAQIIVANATTVASSGANCNSGTAGVIDLGALVDDRGTALVNFTPADDIRLVVTVGVAPTAGTALYFDLEDCATATGTFKKSGVGILAANAIPIATLVAGYEILNVGLPQGLKEFIRILYTTTGNWTGSVGTFNARLEYGSAKNNQVGYRA